MNPETPKFVVGLAVELNPSGEDCTSGSTRGHFCFSCNRELWLSPRGVMLYQEWKAKLSCQFCVAGIAEDEELNMVPPTDEVMDEVNRKRGELGLPAMSKAAMIEIAKAALFKKSDA